MVDGGVITQSPAASVSKGVQSLQRGGKPLGKELVQAGSHSKILPPPWNNELQNTSQKSGSEHKQHEGIWSKLKATFSSGSNKEAGLQQQYMLSTPVVVPAPVIIDILTQVQRSNELLRKESQARTEGMRSLIESVNRNLAATHSYVNAAATAVKGLPRPSQLYGQGMSPEIAAGFSRLDEFRSRVQQPNLRTGPEEGGTMWRAGNALQQAPLYALNDQPRAGVGLATEIAGSSGATTSLHSVQGPHLHLRAESSPWHIPTDVSSSVRNPKQLPGYKWNVDQDLRVATWNLQGLSYRGHEDQHKVEVVAQAVWACQPDLVVFQGLPGIEGVAKVCALLNLWNHSGSSEAWHSFCSPQRTHNSLSDSSGRENSSRAHVGSHEFCAFLWREPYLLPWGGNTTILNHKASAASHGYNAPSYSSSKTIEAKRQLPGSFQVLEAGVKGSAYQALTRDVLVGIFSVGNRPVMVASVHLSPPVSGRTSAAQEGDHKHLASAVQSACRELQNVHEGLLGKMWMIVAGTFNGDSTEVLDASLWEYLVEKEVETHLKRSGFCDNICVSKNASGGSKLNRSDRILQPVSSKGATGEEAEPPFRSGAMVMAHGHHAVSQHALVWGEVRVTPAPGIAPQAPAAAVPVVKPLSDDQDVNRSSLDSRVGVRMGSITSSGSYSVGTNQIPSATGRPTTSPAISYSSKPSTYMEALQSDALKEGSRATNVVSTSQPVSGALRTSTGYSGGFGLGSEIPRSASPQSVSQRSSLISQKGGLMEELRTYSKEDVGFGLFAEDSAGSPKPRSAAAAAALSTGSMALRTARVSTPDGPSTPLTGSPRASVDGLRSGGSGYGLGVETAGGRAGVRPQVSSSLTGRPGANITNTAVMRNSTPTLKY
ncbi:hypothetical protein CEUSTIGMA_g3684.t1 [Chlamydomonas eustigma]|uniref:Endonuclease/exonuclease/phosphatase domain-containing protein n=1 Tax=Chlamydomonas eustigma TaxID=1157962 RepID=A0A250X0F4_9CHLO|nr:hypothetical protein CEUSTIGMA_g3684.t1 [Chlamydomonas eustigma]|eukprot:GAX76240.1 hypothetical protein CEUSTIGMA_g3684.t1 [Chlamydomonas eustigma]